MEASRGRRMWAVCRHESVGAYDGIELGMDFPLDFGVHGHGEGERRNFQDGLLEREVSECDAEGGESKASY